MRVLQVVIVGVGIIGVGIVGVGIVGVGIARNIFLFLMLFVTFHFQRNNEIIYSQGNIDIKYIFGYLLTKMKISIICYAFL